MRFVRTLPLLLVVSGAGASGCITSSPAEYGATPDAKSKRLALCPDGIIDDGEDGNGQVILKEERDGYWFTFGDTEGTKLEPKGPFAMSPGGRPTGGGLPESKFSARVHGKITDSGTNPYAGVGFALSNPKTGFDLSYAKGIQFWAKGPGKVRFKVPDVNTDPVGDRCTDCYNDFGVDLYLSDRWERYTVPFAALEQQPGWGDRAPHVASGAVFAIQWQFTTPGAEFDFSFDDVALVGCDGASAESGDGAAGDSTDAEPDSSTTNDAATEAPAASDQATEKPPSEAAPAASNDEPPGGTGGTIDGSSAGGSSTGGGPTGGSSTGGGSTGGGAGAASSSPGSSSPGAASGK